MSNPDLDSTDPYGIDTQLMALSQPYEEIEGVENTDDVVCVCARNDYLPTDKWVGDMTFSEIMGSTTQEALIDHLMKPPGHYGPFEHPQFTIAINGISRVTMAQLTRHRIGVTFDVQSSRYTMPPEELILAIEAGDEPLERLHDYVVVPKAAYETDRVDGWLAKFHGEFMDYMSEYEAFIDAGLPEERAKEDARYLLPKGLRVNMVMTASLRTYMHIADMRAAGDAQWEIRALTNDLINTISEVAPVSMATYRKYRLDNNLKHRLAP